MKAVDLCFEIDFFPHADDVFDEMTLMGSAAPELILSIQEHQKKVSLALLEKAKAICAEQGVRMIPSCKFSHFPTCYFIV